MYNITHEYLIITSPVNFLEADGCSAIAFENKGDCDIFITRNGAKIQIAVGDAPIIYNTQPGEKITTLWQSITFDAVGTNPYLRVTKEFREKEEKRCGND